MIGIALQVPAPAEILERNPSHGIFDQPRTGDPPAVAAFYGCMADVIVHTNPLRIQTLKHGPQIPDRTPNHTRTGVSVIHTAHLVLFVEISEQFHLWL